jgi:hypothetical protein
MADEKAPCRHNASLDVKELSHKPGTAQQQLFFVVRCTVCKEIIHVSLQPRRDPGLVDIFRELESIKKLVSEIPKKK